MMPRLFFALWPDAAVREALGALRAGLPADAGRPAPARDLHVTLVFLGEIADTSLGAVVAPASRIRVPPFELVLNEVGFFRRARALYLAPREIPPPLSALVAKLREALSGAGFRPEARPYRPHLTLCRKAGGLPPGFRPPPLRWRVRDFSLVESASAPRAARYALRATWPLSPPPGKGR